MSVRRPTLVASALALLACSEPVEPRDAAWFLDRLHQLDDLPRLEPALSELAANYDRAGGNDLDGFVHYRVDGLHNILLDVEGPGCIHRISTGDLALVEDTRIEIRLDDGELLALPVPELFDPEAGPFAGGLTHGGPYPLVRYPTVRMPIPFARRAEVHLVSATADWGVFWQIGYTRYPVETPVETLRLPLAPRTQAALDRAGQAWTDAVYGAKRPPSSDVRVSEIVEPDGILRWDDEGCGTIERLAVAIEPDWPGAWRWLQIRIEWDAAEQAAIEMPLAEFLGTGDYVDDPFAWLDSLIIGARDNRGWLRLPMPYREAARIELHNTSASPMNVALELWRRRCAEQPASFGYPTATSPRSGPGKVPVHRLLDHEGRGKVVGTLMRVDWGYPDLWWGEGDWQIWTDEPLSSWPPRDHGTGTEEFYDGGWTGFERKALTGVIKGRPGLVTVYGFLLNDALSFERNIRMQVETVGLGLGDTVVTKQNPLWSTTVFWYDEQP